MSNITKLGAEYGIAGLLIAALYATFVMWAQVIPPFPQGEMIVPVLAIYAGCLQAMLRGALIVGRWWGWFPPEGWMSTSSSELTDGEAR